MKLSLDAFTSALRGAERAWETPDGFGVSRFTEEEESFYKDAHGYLYSKAQCSAGIRLSFTTDSRTLALAARVTSGASRSYFSFDVWKNGEYYTSFANRDLSIPDEEIPGYPAVAFPLGDFSWECDLGGGEKTVDVWFPFSVAVAVRFSLADGASFVPTAPAARKMILYGDSITHGYDTRRASFSYANRLTRLLHADGVNKAIGGEMFCPGLAACRPAFTPDFITVAYGTNDWSHVSADELAQNARTFLCNLRANHPAVPIFVLTPLWRGDCTETRPLGAFSDVARIIRESAADVAGVRVIDGFDFIPHEPKYFGDGRLHPNDEGGEKIAEAFARAILQAK